VTREGYSAAREGAALARLEDRGLLVATGPDRQKFLQAMISNEVLARKPGEGCAAALFDVKGHVQAFLRVLILEKEVHLELPRSRADAVKAMLENYKVAAPVRFQPKPVAVLALLGPQADSVLGRSGGEPPGDASEAHRETTVAGRTVRVVRAGDLPVAGFVLHVAEEDDALVGQNLRTAGAAPLEPPDLDTLRVEAGRPWFGRDVSEENLLHETGLVSELCSFQKGCYLGQEVIARLDARGGNVSRRLRGLRLDVPAAAGDAVQAEGKEVGRVTTAAVSPRLGPVAMAYVHRSHADAGTAVSVNGRPARVAELPLADDLEKSA
jgi:folate-binding protein YgfZ